ncbi:Arsenical resistance operon trans-acting repressor ArsD [Clostridium cavendishii DSM 21758]|uniref:Arsenical resistance operon trans-acting repressor ArsD n=1 Tax=Clostridium cavendishii DSM 21758 TaxID=1121302 RepID=A0A1M6J7D5_9CLOT|nr:arsenite efflux transporter metallochaperone ArsD [Clostridium cavendishii]SHJ42633.1 Arsenical resistance operon trans-acting repressor ArsD [Clostridium cavendishii DSM 21758]
MKKMIIFDPAMCCSTGVCGPSIDTELLRVATVLNSLKKHGMSIERYNLTSNPQMFVDNKIINELLNSEGIDILPVTIVDGKVIKTKAYLTNKEFCEALEVPETYLKTTIEIKKKQCCCKDGCC